MLSEIDIIKINALYDCTGKNNKTIRSPDSVIEQCCQFVGRAMLSPDNRWAML